MKSLFFILFMLLGIPCWADDCLRYKKNPGVFINVPDWSKTVVQPRKKMDLLHGNVIATLVDNYDIVVDINPVENGFCVGLKYVESIVGYSNFIVQIDMRHVPNSCTYNAVLKHEDKHIKTYLSVIDDFKGELQKSIFHAADSIMPVFVETRDDIDRAVDMINDEFQSHPDIILVKQKIKAAEEIRNKQVDQQETGEDLDKCL